MMYTNNRIKNYIDAETSAMALVIVSNIQPFEILGVQSDV